MLRLFRWFLLPCICLSIQGADSSGLFLGAHAGSRSYGLGGTAYFATSYFLGPRLSVQAYRITPADSISSNLSTSYSVGIGFSNKLYLDYERLSEPLKYPNSFGNGYGIKMGAGYDIKSESFPINLGGFVAYRSGNGNSNVEVGIQITYMFPF